MPPNRLSTADRRASILSAARGIFARHGLEGARTQQIARAAGVSEALVFRHFATKETLYRAVLRDVIREQDAMFAAFGDVEPSAAGLRAIIERLIDHALLGADAANAEGMRLVVGSLTGDGSYARIVYARALKLSLPGLERALAAAQAEGALCGPAISPANAAAFIEHVSTMLMLSRLPRRPSIPYAGDQATVRAEAIAFCMRGIGLAAPV